MKCLVLCLFAAAAYPQITPPPRTVETRMGAASTQVTLTRSVNGREVPVESTEERVISESAGVRIVERVVKRFDANGNPGPPERVRIETRTEPDGTVRTATNILRGDINGSMQVFERSVAVMRKSGDNSETIVTVERPTLNAGFEVVERREQSVRSLGAGKATESSVIQKPDPNGRMTEIARKQVQRTVTPSGIVENVAEFEAVATGQLQLSRQIVSHTTKSADGSARTQMDVFEPAPPGKAQAPGAPPQIVRRQVVEIRETPSGTVQTVSSAFPRASNPGSLGPVTQVEKSVCSGDCGKQN